MQTNAPPTVEITTITPIMAEEWITSNTRNRPLSKPYYTRLAAEMESGKFVLTGAAICFDWNGVLIDGQHRLYACQESRQSFTALVIRNLDPNVFTVIDTGRTRSGADALAVAGLGKPPQSNRLASTLTLIDRFSRGVISGAKKSNEDLLKLSAQHPNAMTSVRLCWDAKGLVQPGSLAAMHYLFSKLDQQAADSFVHSIKNGDNLKAGSPLHTLRERLNRNQASNAKLLPVDVAAICIKTWNAIRDGKEKISTLKWVSKGDRAESFPEIK